MRLATEALGPMAGGGLGQLPGSSPGGGGPIGF